MFNGSITVLTAIIFGWAAFIGFAFNLLANPNFLGNLRELPLVLGAFRVFITVVIPVVFFIMASFFYARILQFGRWIYQLENDLGLRDYCNRLPRLWTTELSIRADAESWTNGEKTAVFVLGIYFITPFLFLVRLALLTP